MKGEDIFQVHSNFSGQHCGQKNKSNYISQRKFHTIPPRYDYGMWFISVETRYTCNNTVEYREQEMLS